MVKFDKFQSSLVKLSGSSSVDALINEIVSYIREPTTTIKTSKISKQFSLTLQLTSVTTIYFNEEQLSRSGGGIATLGGYAVYTRVG